MSFTFIRDDDACLHLNRDGWFKLQHLSKLHGWRPIGAISVHSQNEICGYNSNDGQLMTSSDAGNFSNALISGAGDESALIETLEVRDPLLDQFISMMENGSEDSFEYNDVNKDIQSLKELALEAADFFGKGPVSIF